MSPAVVQEVLVDLVRDDEQIVRFRDARDELELLDTVARATVASRSELIRRAVRSTFGQPSKADKLQALEASAGSWRGRRFSGSESVDSVRGDLDERLSRLGLE